MISFTKLATPENSSPKPIQASISDLEDLQVVLAGIGQRLTQMKNRLIRLERNLQSKNDVNLASKLAGEVRG